MRRVVTATVVIVAAALLFTGCSMGGGASSSADRGGSAVQPDLAAPGQAGGSASDGSKELAGTDALATRAVVTTGTLSVTTKDPIGAADRTIDIVTTVSGRVDSRSETPGTDTYPASATLVIRVPADAFEATAAKLRDLGMVTDFTTNASDVTQQTTDLNARVKALQASVDRLTTLMASASSTEDLISIENSLSQRQADLDSLKAQRDWLADQVAYSTLTVQFFAPGVIAEPGPDSFWGGIVAGWNAMLAFFGGLAIALGVLVPWLIPLGVAAVIVVLVLRSARRNRRQPPAEPPVVDGASVG